MNGASTEPLVNTASAPYTTARIMTGMSQNFLRTIAKRHRSTRIRIAAPYWLQLASTPLLASARRVRNRSFRLATDHDVEAAVLAARQQHLDLAGEPIEAAAGAARREQLLVVLELDIADRGHARDKLDIVALEPREHLAHRMLALVRVLVLVAEPGGPAPG